jgi:hypothetical protein
MTKPFYDSTKRCPHGIPYYNRCLECEIVLLESRIEDATNALEKANRKLKKVREEQREAKKK